MEIPNRTSACQKRRVVLPGRSASRRRRSGHSNATRRPILAADIAHFGEDETVIMRRKGGWIRVYRAHHKGRRYDHRRAHRQSHAGHRCPRGEQKLTAARATVAVPGVGGGLVDRLAELDLAVVPYDGGEAPIDKGAVRQNLEQRTTGPLRELFRVKTRSRLDPEDDKLAAQLGSIKCGMNSRGRIKTESQKTTCASAACRHPTGRCVGHGIRARAEKTPRP